MSQGQWEACRLKKYSSEQHFFFERRDPVFRTLLAGTRLEIEDEHGNVHPFTVRENWGNDNYVYELADGSDFASKLKSLTTPYLLYDDTREEEGELVEGDNVPVLPLHGRAFAHQPVAVEGTLPEAEMLSVRVVDAGFAEVSIDVLSEGGFSFAWQYSFTERELLATIGQQTFDVPSASSDGTTLTMTIPNLDPSRDVHVMTHDMIIVDPWFQNLARDYPNLRGRSILYQEHGTTSGPKKLVVGETRSAPEHTRMALFSNNGWTQLSDRLTKPQNTAGLAQIFGVSFDVRIALPYLKDIVAIPWYLGPRANVHSARALLRAVNVTPETLRADIQTQLKGLGELEDDNIDLLDDLVDSAKVTLEFSGLTVSVESGVYSIKLTLTDPAKFDLVLENTGGTLNADVEIKYGNSSYLLPATETLLEREGATITLSPPFYVDSSEATEGQIVVSKTSNHVRFPGSDIVEHSLWDRIEDVRDLVSMPTANRIQLETVLQARLTSLPQSDITSYIKPIFEKGIGPFSSIMSSYDADTSHMSLHSKLYAGEFEKMPENIENTENTLVMEEFTSGGWVPRAGFQPNSSASKVVYALLEVMGSSADPESQEWTLTVKDTILNDEVPFKHYSIRLMSSGGTVSAEIANDDFRTSSGDGTFSIIFPSSEDFAISSIDRIQVLMNKVVRVFFKEPVTIKNHDLVEHYIDGEWTNTGGTSWILDYGDSLAANSPDDKQYATMSVDYNNFSRGKLGNGGSVYLRADELLTEVPCNMIVRDMINFDFRHRLRFRKVMKVLGSSDIPANVEGALTLAGALAVLNRGETPSVKWGTKRLARKFLKETYTDFDQSSGSEMDWLRALGEREISEGGRQAGTHPHNAIFLTSIQEQLFKKLDVNHASSIPVPSQHPNGFHIGSPESGFDKTFSSYNPIENRFSNVVGLAGKGETNQLVTFTVSFTNTEDGDIISDNDVVSLSADPPSDDENQTEYQPNEGDAVYSDVALRVLAVSGRNQDTFGIRIHNDDLSPSDNIKFDDRIFAQVPSVFRSGDLKILNESRKVPASNPIDVGSSYPIGSAEYTVNYGETMFPNHRWFRGTLPGSMPGTIRVLPQRLLAVPVQLHYLNPGPLETTTTVDKAGSQRPLKEDYGSLQKQDFFLESEKALRETLLRSIT